MNARPPVDRAKMQNGCWNVGKAIYWKLSRSTGLPCFGRHSTVAWFSRKKILTKILMKLLTSFHSKKINEDSFSNWTFVSIFVSIFYYWIRTLFLRSAFQIGSLKVGPELWSWEWVWVCEGRGAELPNCAHLLHNTNTTPRSSITHSELSSDDEAT